MSLLASADSLGHSAGMSALKTSLGEEKAMAEWIVHPTTLKFVERSAAGQTAGV